MRTLWLVILALLCVCPPAHATWTMVQHVSHACATATTCAVTVTSTGASHLIIAAVHTSANTRTISSMASTGGTAMTWVHCPACAQGGSGSVDMDYTLASTSGNTTITFTFSASTTSPQTEITEYSTTAGPPIFDISGNKLISAAAPTAVAMTLTGSNDVVFSISDWSGAITGCPSPYSNPADFLNGGEQCGAINVSTATAVAFTPTTSGSGPFAGIAFKETGTTVTVKPRGVS